MSQASNFVKKLASNDKPTRDAALESLKKFLISKSASSSSSSKTKTFTISLLDAEKLWKGLYYSMWFCDRPKAQERLAENLGRLYSENIKSDDVFLRFVEAFNLIMTKQWSDIDQWRIDKYYLLIRRVLRHNFKYLKSHDWDEPLVRDWVDVMSRTLLSGDAKVPVALPYHLCDIYLDELQLVMFEELAEEEAELDKEDPKYLQKYETLLRQKIAIVEGVPVLKLIEPFSVLNKEAKLKPLREKCKEDVLDDERLVDWAVVGDDSDSDVDGEGDNGSAEQDDEEEEEEEWKGF
ncbi:hypothetical protein KGF57_000006 [Candida theae]|uniref:Ribosomal RNA-processing protein 1 n=1 Tax=Candida theae TaxID=1198502 RepID=A0AAD5BKR6_9ASCO|nr:uncharacterized protein KGF57_000006 [Candida theae]KAI5968891.1 hypothetical protein KGF57_000006 [Candida theae]